jgi:hypothetical protein
MRWMSVGWCMALAALAVSAALLAPVRAEAASSIVDDPSCWTMLNELAAAAVFADLTDDKLESVYALLDQLQDHCEAHAYDEATKTMRKIEMLVGK